MTAALWFRITLKDLCGIEAGDNIWFNGRTKSLSHAGALGLDKEGPRSVEHHWLSADETLDQMLDRGKLDLVTAIRPQPRATAGDATAGAARSSPATRASGSCFPTTARRSCSTITARPASSSQTIT